MRRHSVMTSGQDRRNINPGKPVRVLCMCMSLALAVCMTGCGESKSAKAPELLEPISTNEAYRPVMYSDIGSQVIKTGTVVPTDYCYFFDSATTLSQVYVNVGDEVKKDTVLAEADTTSDSSDDTDSDSTDSDGSESTDVKKYTHEIQQKIFQQNQAELDWKIKACEEVGDTEGAAESKTEKAVNAENNRYDNLLYEYEMKKLQEQSDSDEEKKQSGTLTCEHDGHVTYVKQFSDGEKSVSANENVVVVSDYSEPYIEITGETYKKSNYESYNNMYAVIDGTRYELELYNYTNQEIATAQSSSSMPYTRFKLKDVKDVSKILSVGNSVSLHFSRSDASNVLTVGNDSLYEESGQYFVYVKTDTSDKERRDIEIGTQDSNYTEVVSGLTEGELVYYASESMMPADYTEYTIELGQYKSTSSNSEFTVEELNSVTYTAPCDGRFTEFSLEVGTEVKKGDVLFVIDSGGGTAAVKELDSQINEENQSYSSQLGEYNDQMAELSEQIEEYKTGKASPTDAQNILYMAEQLTCQRNVVSYNKDLLTYTHNSTISSLTAQKEKLNKNNDGSGKISVYAEQDGTVTAVTASSDTSVSEGANVVTIGGGGDKIIALTASDGKIGLNQQVTITNKNDSSKKIIGTCVGTTGDSSKSYIMTDSDGKVHITKCSGGDELKYYIKVEDTKVYDKPKAYQISYPTAVYEDVVLVPNNMIYHEVSNKDSSEYDYVWLIKDDQIIKQYVTLGDSAKNQRMILTGLSEGDVIAKESGASSSVTTESDSGNSSDNRNSSGNGASDSDSGDDGSDSDE